VSTQFFVLSTGRCGSTLLSNALRAHPEVLSLSELFRALGGSSMLTMPALSGRAWAETLASPDADLRELLRRTSVPEILARGSGEARAELAPLLLVTLPHLSDAPEALWRRLRSELESWPRATVAEHLTRLCDCLRTMFSRRLWVERSGGSIEYAEELARAFPEARFVHLVREGWAAALSMSKHAFFRVHLARLVSRDPMRPVADCLKAKIPLDRFGAYWSVLMHKTERMIRSARRGEAQLLLRYEQLVSEPASALRRLGEVLALEAGVEEWIKAASGMVRASEARLADLAPADRARLLRACSPGMRVLDRLDAADRGTRTAAMRAGEL
jgi:hypothetical protein